MKRGIREGCASIGLYFSGAQNNYTDIDLSFGHSIVRASKEKLIPFRAKFHRGGPYPYPGGGPL